MLLGLRKPGMKRKRQALTLKNVTVVYALTARYGI